MQPLHNLGALLSGTVEFSFSEGASTLAETQVKGYRDFGNITALTPQLDVEKLEHTGSYRGVTRKDKTIVIKQGMTYILKMDEFKLKNMMILLGGDQADSFTQDAFTGLTGTQPDSWTFTVNDPSTAMNWYDIKVDSEQLMHLDSVDFVYEAAVNATCDATANTIGATAHGR